MAFANGLYTMHDLTPFIGTALSSSTWTYATLGAGIENMAEALNEVVQQYFFMADGGFATNHVTGMAPAYTFTGRRVFGDDAQDYIFSKKFDLNGERKTSFKLEWNSSSGSSSGHSIVCDATICNIQEFSGASNEDAAISFEIRFDGEPTVS